MPFQDVDYFIANAGDIGYAVVTNRPCATGFGGVVNFNMPDNTGTPSQGFALAVTGNEIDITMETDGDGNLATPLSVLVAAIAANPAAAALVVITAIAPPDIYLQPLTQVLGLTGMPVTCPGPSNSYIYGG
jgi:hypothetical protein